MSQRRKFTDEFKREAVNLLNQSDVTIKQIASELGINPAMLGRWRRELSTEGDRAFQGKGNARDKEMAELKRELARVRKERDFLREAATFFAKQSK